MGKGPEQRRLEFEHCENKWDACTGRCKTDIDHGTTKIEGSRVQAEPRTKNKCGALLHHGTSTLPLAVAGTDGIVDVRLRIDSHLLDTETNAGNGNAFQLTRNSWTLYNQSVAIWLKHLITSLHFEEVCSSFDGGHGRNEP